MTAMSEKSGEVGEVRESLEGGVTMTNISTLIIIHRKIHLICHVMNMTILRSRTLARTKKKKKKRK
jgi:hypothetical protein